MRKFFFPLLEIVFKLIDWLITFLSFFFVDFFFAKKCKPLSDAPIDERDDEASFQFSNFYF